MVFSSVTFVLVFLPCFLLAYFFLYGLKSDARLSVPLLFAVASLILALRFFNGLDVAGLTALLALGFVALVALFRFFPEWKKQLGLPLCNVFLFAASLLFYAWGEPVAIFLLLASTLINYGFGLLIGLRQDRRKQWLWLGVALNLLLLASFKYAVFLLSNALELLHFFWPEALVVEKWPRLLPMGISFYTFQGLSYLIDVYRDETPPERNLIDFGCYLTMFPQLVAGPIVRYASIARELRERVLSLEGFTAGASRFILGLSKKMLIADTLGRTADAAFGIPATELSALWAWVGAVCYTLQIYFDFSGYSDMAIGIGRMLGFTFPENFRYPYIAESVKDFWRRWHMTLSSWFRDYVYIPLGGNRAGGARTAVNLLAVFVLCGFWHGAAWNFLFWGLWHGLFLVIERLFPRFPGFLPRPLRHLYTLLAVILGWVLFRADSGAEAVVYMQALFGTFSDGPMANRVWQQFFCGDTAIALVWGLLFATPLLPRISARLDGAGLDRTGALRLFGLLALLFLCFFPLFGATYNAFIYFRF